MGTIILMDGVTNNFDQHFRSTLMSGCLQLSVSSMQQFLLHIDVRSNQHHQVSSSTGPPTSPGLCPPPPLPRAVDYLVVLSTKAHWFAFLSASTESTHPVANRDIMIYLWSVLLQLNTEVGHYPIHYMPCAAPGYEFFCIRATIFPHGD